MFGLLSPLSWAELVDLLVVSNAILGLVLAMAGWPIAVLSTAKPDRLVAARRRVLLGVHRRRNCPAGVGRLP